MANGIFPGISVSGFTERSIAAPEQLKSLGVNIDDINSGVEAEIETVKATTFGEDEFFQDVQTIQTDNELDYDTAFDEALKYYKSKGYSIEGIDIDEELGTVTEFKEEIVEEETEEEPTSFIGRQAERTTEAIPGILEGFKEGTENIIGGAISELPQIVSNVGGFFIGKPIDAALEAVGIDAPSLEEQFKADGIESKQDFQKFFGVDPESFTTQVGEFGADVGTLFVPGGQTKLATKFPGAVNKIKKLGTVIEKAATNAPKTLNTLKLALTGAKEAAKFGVVSEGEISPTGVVIGAIANPVIDKGGKLIQGLVGKDVTKGMTQVFKPSKPKGVTAKQIADDMDIIASSLKTNQKRPEVLGKLYDDLIDIQKGLYNKQINPALKAAKEGGDKIDFNNMVDDIVTSISGTKAVKGQSLAKIFGKGDEAKALAQTAGDIKKLGKLDFLEAEQIKQYTSALSQANRDSGNTLLSSMQKDFVEKLNQQLGNQMDDAINKLTGVGIKQFKTEYGAIARHMDELNRRMINESKLAGDSLFSGLGKIAGVREILAGNVSGGLSQIFTGEILKKLRDPDSILKRTMDQLYKGPGAGVLEKTVGVGAQEAGQFLDVNK